MVGKKRKGFTKMDDESNVDLSDGNQCTSVSVKSTKEIAKIIANYVHMPYCWEDIKNRLEKGAPLPFKLEDKQQKENDFIFDVNNSKFFDDYQIASDGKMMILLHQNGEDKKATISQLKLMIKGIEDDFDWFAG